VAAIKPKMVDDGLLTALLQKAFGGGNGIMLTTRQSTQGGGSANDEALL